MAELSSSDGVFINCPFDRDYSSTFDALIFAVFACGFRPRSARELDDASQTRIDKIYGIIEACRYGVHDLSRTQLDAAHGLPRFNMPLELGIFLGAKRFGDGAQSLKRCLVLDTEPYRYQKRPRRHGYPGPRGRHPAGLHLPAGLAGQCLATPQHSGRAPAAGDRFLADKPIIAAGLGFDPADIPYVDYENMVTTWLLTARP